MILLFQKLKQQFKQQVQNLWLWFVTGMALAVGLTGVGTPQPLTYIDQPHDTVQIIVSDFAATHQEPNFYQ